MYSFSMSNQCQSGNVAWVMYLCSPERADEGDYRAGHVRMIPLEKLEPFEALNDITVKQLYSARVNAMLLIEGISKALQGNNG